MSEHRYYTLDEANRQLPTLRALFPSVLQIRAQLKTLYERLERAGYAPGSDDDSEEPAPLSVVRDRQLFDALVETLREHVEQIRSTGCTIKDIEVGLVDWLARDELRGDVWLCWRYGESEVSFFHEMDAGFAGRRPVSELREPPAEP